MQTLFSLLVNATLFRIFINAIQNCTLIRLEISFSMNRLCYLLHYHTEKNWVTTYRLLMYLKGSLNHGLILYSLGSLNISTYTNVDWVLCSNDRQSTLEYCVFLGPLVT